MPAFDRAVPVGIQLFEFLACHGDREGPMDLCLGLVALSFPCRDLAAQHVAVVNPALQALAIHDANLDFRHV